MNRRDLFRLSTALGVAAALPAPGQAARPAVPAAAPLAPPAHGAIAVAFLLSDDAVVIDFAGPWEVFANVAVPGRGDAPVFQLYTVAETLAPVRAVGGMTIIPTHTFASAPQPQVIVIPAQQAPSAAVLAWVRAASRGADLTMSVCTGAFLLAQTGLLSGLPATTHHGAYSEFAMAFPDVALKRGARYVESGKLASAGGLSSGIDLALRVVERYFGRAVASSTADSLEYQGQGWLNPDANQAYARRRRSSAAHPLCPVCDMEVDRTLSAAWRGKTYYFCMASHQALFEQHPAAFLAG
ncbi:DJ-1/PfpI family protein [Oxalobacteraceae bacterium A2-2]